MTNWLVVGSRGMLGQAVLAALRERTGDYVAAPSRRELDLVDASSVAAGVAAHQPDIVVNLAAYTAVDAAESDAVAAHAVNATGPAALAASCAGNGARLVHVSTDYVFPGVVNGAGPRPYEPGDETGPRTVYGATKLAGEQAVRDLLAEHHIVRTAWLYGAAGPNFVATMARLERERDTVDVVADQQGSPTWTADLATALVELATSDAPYGTHHYAGSGPASWYELACAVFDEVGADPGRVRPCDTARVPRPAPRPAWSVLGDRAWRAAGLTPPRPWRNRLAAAFRTEGAGLRGER